MTEGTGIAKDFDYYLAHQDDLVERNLTVLEDDPYRSSELALAPATLVERPDGILPR